MTRHTNRLDDAKILAGKAALDAFVLDGMTIGLGSGSTSQLFVRALGDRVRAGLNITATTTSHSTADIARQVGIAITDINDIGALDLTIDGTDEIDRSFRMIKGGGACLLWEKIAAQASQKMIAICDETKIVDTLGAFPLPVEIVRFGWKQTAARIEQVMPECIAGQVRCVLRQPHGNALVTDSGHYILDCHCTAINHPQRLEIALNMIPGVVENGLFTREAYAMVVGALDGSVTISYRQQTD